MPKTHLQSGTKFYEVWKNMKRRCNESSYHSYNRYGGRGIKYCRTWENFEGFNNDMREGYREGLTLDRRENDWGYSKENCRWITMQQQNKNRRSNIMYKGKCVTDWANELGLKPKTVHSRIRKYNWSIEKALGLF